MSIRDNIRKIEDQKAEAAHQAGREANEIELVAVSKLQSIDKILQAKEAGIALFGENRVQELLAKIPLLPDSIHWHLVGHLQSNKINKVLGTVEMIQSVDSLDLLRKLSAAGERNDISSSVLLQVNTSAEQTKFGFEPGDVEHACELVEKLPNITILGLMTIGPLTDSQPRIGKSFSTLRSLAERIRTYQLVKSRMEILSMGMTADFEIAVREGSTMVRIGSAIFGPRE